ncbi:CatB-related O-acetyltransferase [Azospirillum sp. A39]|uniref:CatB-related O-acetyltransferase n=1 Tax=Azospirillum sp. A39 TaxID=3462279 RepID=UPI004045FA71
MPAGPDPASPHPMPGHPRVGFLKAFVTRPTIVVGDHTYYDDPAGPERFERDNVLYHFDFIGDRLVIGRFCAIAAGARFIMNGANHAMAGFSTYPFAIFPDWQAPVPDLAGRGDTVVGNDVWIGMEALVMPGVRIGDGAVIGARAVVTRDVAPYAVVAGNPAAEMRRRFDDATVAALRRIAWWDWPAETIQRNLAAIAGADLAALERAAAGH